MHDVGVALAGDEVLGRLRLAAGVDHRPRLRQRLRLQYGVLNTVILALEAPVVALPQILDDIEPFRSAGVAVVVLLEADAVLLRLVLPPRRDDVERQPAAAADVVDVGGLLGQQGRVVERRPHGDHVFQSLGDGGEGGGGGPGVERRRLLALDVVEVQLGDQRQVVADLLAALGQPLGVVPRRRHVLVFDVAQPAAEDGEPVAVSHFRRPPSAETPGLRDNRPAARTGRTRPRSARRPQNSTGR